MSTRIMIYLLVFSIVFVISILSISTSVNIWTPMLIGFVAGLSTMIIVNIYKKTLEFVKW